MKTLKKVLITLAIAYLIGGFIYNVIVAFTDRSEYLPDYDEEIYLGNFD